MQRAAKAFARLRLLVGDKLTDLVARKPWIVPKMAAMEAGRAMVGATMSSPQQVLITGTDLSSKYLWVRVV